MARISAEFLCHGVGSLPDEFLWARHSDLCTESGQNETDRAPSSPFQQEPEHQGAMGGLQRPECYSGLSIVDSRDVKQASSVLRDSQVKDSLEHFLGLRSQGLMAKVVSESVLPKHIQPWKRVMDSLPEHVFNFTRKAMSP